MAVREAGTMKRFRAQRLRGRHREVCAVLLRVAFPALILCIMTLPDPLLAARLELRVTGTASTAATLLVGDVVDVDVWVDSESATLSGAAVFLTFDGDVFELVDQDRDAVLSGFQPFSPGAFFDNGEIFRNEMLADDDPAASPAGEQLDFSVVRATRSGSGPTATFRLRARSPSAGSTIRIDESGIRETRYFMPDGSAGAFRFISPLTVAVRGISLENVPAEMVLARGAVDSTTFRLDNLLFDPLYAADQIEWHVEAPDAIGVDLDAGARRLTITAPGDQSLWEQLTLRAANPDGQTTSAVIEIFVNAAPELPATVDDVALEEDGSQRLSLDDLVVDPDAPDAQLTWAVRAPDNVGVRIEGPPYELAIEPRPDWSGSGEILLTVSDNFGFTDSLAFRVDVASVNDAPQSLFSPNLRVTRGKADSSLALGDLFADAEERAADLRWSWTGAERIGLETRDGRLVVSAPEAWEGSEAIQLTVIDDGDLSATTQLTVTVVPSLAPAIAGAPQRLGIAAGTDSVLQLADYVVDPDDPTDALRWSVDGHSGLLVQISSTGAARIEAPDAFSGIETVRFTAADPSGETASFDLLVFAAPEGGEPLLSLLPALDLPPNGADATLDLDDYVFDLDDAPAAMTWSVSGPESLELRVDAGTHVLTVLASDSLGGAFDVTVTVRDPDGHETSGLLRVSVAVPDLDPDPDPVDPGPLPVLSLLPLPTVRVTSGGFDQSLVLDQYIESGDPEAVRWEATGGAHTQVLVDPSTRQVTVLAAADWTGPEPVQIRALDDSGRLIFETMVGVQIVAPVPNLALADLVEIAALAGDSLAVVDATSLLAVDVDPADLDWEAISGADTFAVQLDTGSRNLQLTGSALTAAGSRVVTVIARDGAGNQATGKLLVQVLPDDGSAGDERDGFDVTVVPNPIQPEFLDLYVLSDDERFTPRLRTGPEAWQDLALTPVTGGIWHGSHTLTAGMEGAVDFLALAMEGQRLTRSRLQIHVGTAPAAAGKTVGGAGFRLDVAAGDFAGEAVVAVIPHRLDQTVKTVGGELREASGAFEVHATRPLQSQPYLSLRTTDGAPALAHTHVYRWDGSADAWQFVGGERDGESVGVSLQQLGRYALFVDDTAPRIEPGDSDRFRVADAGSGVATVELIAEGAPVEGAVDFDGDIARLTGIAPAGARLALRATDRAGNTATLAVTVDNPVPLSFELGQNFPNPFNPETSIPLRVAAGGQPVQLTIYNGAGQAIRLLLERDLTAGQHGITWDGRDDAGRAVSSGTYFYRALVGDAVFTRRMTLLR